MGEISKGFQREAQHRRFDRRRIGTAGAASYGVNIYRSNWRLARRGQALGSGPGGLVSKGSEFAGGMVPNYFLWCGGMVKL